jgi:glucosamine-6-phosphate deaminase
VVTHADRVALVAAELVANRLRARPDLRLILPTGHTPMGMYAALRSHLADGSLPTHGATLFQLDEYLGLAPEDPRSYQSYLRRELGGVRFGTTHFLDGGSGDPDLECARHQQLLDEAPVDLAVLGLGRDGHVAFDEPGSTPEQGVRRVQLHPQTRQDAVPDFGTLDAVPLEALTVGLRTLLQARELLLLVSGQAKAAALRAMLVDPPSPDSPASLLRQHPRLTIVCDTAAASLLDPAPGWSSDRALIVLGHREPGISAEHRISAESHARLRRAEAVARAHPPRVVVLTGYTRIPSGLSEAEQMKADWRLPEVPTLLENAGRNTAENASRSLPILRAIGDIHRVTVITSAWHVRAAYFFAPYRMFGLRLSFAPEFGGPWLRPLASELGKARTMRRERIAAMAAMRLPAELELPEGSP